MVKYEVTIIWCTGEKEVFSVQTEERGYEVVNDMKCVFGSQISFACVNHKQGNY